MATYEANHDGLDVTIGQAFEYENQSARWSTVKKSRATHQINEMFRIQEVNGMFKVQYLQNGAWHYHQVVIALDGTPQSWFAFSYDEALVAIEAYMALLEWMSGFAASTQEAPIVPTPKKDYRVNRYIAQPIALYQGENTSERTTGIVKEFDEATRTGVAYIEDGTRIVYFRKRECGKGFKIAS